MKIMVVGGGGREHAIIKKLKENKEVEKIYALPGNGGISFDAECISIGVMDFDGIISFARDNFIDFAVVGPDNPLAEGAVDRLTEAGIPCFGPDKKAALIESSKAYAKDFMRKYGIPTAEYQIFDNKDEAMEFAKSYPNYPLVIKADGLALGKGVFIASTFDDARVAIDEIMHNKIFGSSGDRIVLEECLTGPEVTVLCFTDSKTIVPMISSMDYKRIYDNDEGPNTGGMGVVAPNPFYTKTIAEQCMKEIFQPTVEALNEEGRPFKGCLYFGLMLTKQGPKVIEYNCRFGDPEAQAVLPLLKTDLLTVMKAVYDESLSSINVEFSNKHACCVIAASQGYPGSFETGKKIMGQVHDSGIFHSGTKISESTSGNEKVLVTSGGRVLGVTALGDSLEEAIAKAYEKLVTISFEKMYYRKDIGKKAIERQGSE